MPTALFLSLPMHGHVNPSLPLVQELVGRGHEVVYYSDDPFAAQVGQTGARYRPYGARCLSDLGGVAARLDELPWLLTRTAASILATHLTAFREERPDYVITDSLAPWGQWAGEILRVPVVTSVSTFAFNRHVLSAGVAQGVRPKSVRRLLVKFRSMSRAFLLGRQLRRLYGARGPGLLGTVLGRSDLNIVYTSRSFQPCADSFDGRFHFAGPLGTARSESGSFPWDQVRHPTVVYVSLGTLFNTEAAFYRDCFEAFAGQACQVILSTGSEVSTSSLGDVPPNFIVQAHVPQLEILRRASAFVTHGGMNSVSESLYHGVPMVVIPHAGEQAIVGRRVEALGAGVYLEKEHASPERLREAVRAVTQDQSFRDRAAAIRRSFLETAGASGAADAILAYTGRAQA
ncbi:glycosyltransferase [soil metagenome]